MLWIRPLDSVAVQPLAGTEGAGFPFWSPDSRFIAFLAPGKLKKIGVSGGAPLTLTDVSFSAGSFSFGSTGAWNQDDVILFTPAGGSPLYRVSASGGTASQVTTLDTASGEAQHWFPSFLPDGRHFLYSAVGTKTGGLTDPRGVYVRSLDPAEKSTQLLTSGSNARYAQGHLIFLRGGTLMAQAFDVNRLELSGEAVPLAEEVQRGGTGLTGAAGAFSVSDTAVLAYQTASSTVRAQLAWFDRTGRQIALLGDQADYGDVALSPDGKRVAVSLLDPTRGTRDLWLYDVARGVRTPFTSDPEDEFAPAWSPGGDRLVFSARRNGNIDLYEKPSSGAGREDLLLGDSLGKYQSSSSGDGRFLVYVAGGGVIGRSGLWILPRFGDRKPFPFLETRFVQTHGQFSPDGRWIAYTSNESGRGEVYVAPFPATGVRVRGSPAGGSWPRWGRDGKELLYLAPDDTLTVATVAGGASGFAVGAVRPMFATHPRPFARLDAYAYDVSPDGQRILINTLVEAKTSLAITLVVNWPVGLKK